jgi:serine/threonine protein kinase
MSTTQKIPFLKKLQKCSRSRIIGMETYKINCGVQDYNKPVIVKVYDSDNFHLPFELKILKVITGYRNTTHLICDFELSCKDNENKLHFFVYEYIANGDVSDFLDKNPDENKIKSLLLQITCVIIQLATIYNIYHGDINSGNLLIDTTNDGFIDYCIEGESITIETYGIMPKIIDYGRSNFYKKNVPIPISDVWFDVIMAFGVIYPYIQNVELKKQVYDISQTTTIHDNTTYNSLIQNLPFW